MHFAYPLPWWAFVSIAIAVASLALLTYRRLPVALSRSRLAWLFACRTVALLLLVALVLRPVRSMSPDHLQDAIVPILVDTSRSMQLADAGGQRRIDRAAHLVRTLQPVIARDFHTEVLAFGDHVAPLDIQHPDATARRSLLQEALRGVRDRYRGRPVAGIVLVSDGGDTGGTVGTVADDRHDEGGIPPVIAIGVGSPAVRRDREVLSVTAGDARLADSTVTLTVSAVSHEFGAAPLELRVLANGRVVDAERVTPAADGSPVHASFDVVADLAAPTLYTVEIPSESGELTVENNRRSVLVSPPARPRKILLVGGAPGFEHGFLRRAWSLDKSLEIDSVVRKGRNEVGAPTYFVQAAAERTAALGEGFPATRQALFAYDAIVFGHVLWDELSRQQLGMTADFVSERGGGVLVLGSQSFGQRTLTGTPLEAVLPVELTDRRGGVVRASASRDAALPNVNKVALTRAGDEHPVMKLGATVDETRRRWAAMPELSSSAALGAARPGASVLAITTATGGDVRPLVAVQRYGRGRAMIFGGEASWRWRMMLPASDRTYELFWRQVVRWLSADAPDLVEIEPIEGGVPGDEATVKITVRDPDFRPVRDARVRITVTQPGGQTGEVKAALDAATGRLVGRATLDRAGVYHVSAEAYRGEVRIGVADRWLLVGGADVELADPRLNEDVLRRMAAKTSGQYVTDTEVDQVPRWLSRVRTAAATPIQQDIWHNGWMLGGIVAIVGLEWTLRRRWGLR